MIDFLDVMSSVVQIAWIASGLTLSIIKDVFGPMMRRKIRKPTISRWVWAELRPVYLPACFVHTFCTAAQGELHDWGIYVEALSYLNWFILKDADEDDRWKRRREKLAETVQRVGARLVVVPAKT